MFRHVPSSVLKILKKMGPLFVNKVHKRSVFGYVHDVQSLVLGPNQWDVRMCSKFDPLKMEMFKVRFFNVHSTSRLYLQTILFVSTTI